MNMKSPSHALLFSVAFLCLLIPNAAQDPCAFAGATAPSEFRYTTSIEGDFQEGIPAEVTLPAHIIEKTAYDFSDLRIYDDRGEEVPYVIHMERCPAVVPNRFAFKVLSYDSGENADTIVLEQPDPTQPFNSVEIATSAQDYRKTVQVESGRSLGNWTLVGEDAIFDFSSKINLRRNRIDLPVCDAPFLRLTIERQNKPETTDRKVTLEYDGLFFEATGQEERPFRIDRIQGIYGPLKPEAFSFDRVSVADPKASMDSDGNTVIPLGGVNLPVASVAFQVTNAFFHRRVEVWTAREDREDAYRPKSSGDIYRIPGMVTPEVTLSGLQVQDPYITLKILNEDNPPLDIAEIELAWVRRNLYFFPAIDRTYAFFFGSEAAKRPLYETGKILSADAIQKGGFQELAAGPTLEHAAFDPALSDREKERMQRFVLSLFVVLALVGLSIWGYSMVKQLPPRTEEP